MDFKQLIKLEIHSKQLEKMILMFSVKILQFGYISQGMGPTSIKRVLRLLYSELLQKLEQR